MEPPAAAVQGAAPGGGLEPPLPLTCAAHVVEIHGAGAARVQHESGRGYEEPTCCRTAEAAITRGLACTGRASQRTAVSAACAKRPPDVTCRSTDSVWAAAQLQPAVLCGRRTAPQPRNSSTQPSCFSIRTSMSARLCTQSTRRQNQSEIIALTSFRLVSGCRELPGAHRPSPGFSAGLGSCCWLCSPAPRVAPVLGLGAALHRVLLSERDALPSNQQRARGRVLASQQLYPGAVLTSTRPS